MGAALVDVCAAVVPLPPSRAVAVVGRTQIRVPDPRSILLCHGSPFDSVYESRRRALPPWDAVDTLPANARGGRALVDVDIAVETEESLGAAAIVGIDEVVTDAAVVELLARQ